MSETLSVIESAGRRTRAAAALYLGLSGDAPLTPGARASLRGIDRVDLARSDKRRVERAHVAGADILAVALADARMSSQHARITRIGGAWVLEDLGSKNGTRVGNERVERHTLEDGDVIVVGHTALVFRTAGGEAGDLEAPATIAPGLATLSPTLAELYGHLDS